MQYGVYQQWIHQTEFLSRTKWALYWLEAVSYSKEKSKSLYFLFFWKTSYRPPLPPCLPLVALSPCSMLRSTGELYLICDRIILLFSLHLVHAGDIALEWENHWLVVWFDCVCICVYAWSGGTFIWRCTVCMMWNTLQKTNDEKCVPVCSMCLLPSTVCLRRPWWDVCTTDILELFYVILIVCVFNLHRTIQSNYRVILRSPQTKSHEWNPVAGRGVLLSGPKASIMGLQW